MSRFRIAAYSSHRTSSRSSKSRRRTAPLRVETLESRTLLTVSMSPQEQLFIELVNRARANPEAEVQRNSAVETLNQDVADDRLISSDPKPPLAPHQALIDAMIGHVKDMLQRDFFGHDNPDGEGPSDRARAAGYPTGAGENIAWSGNTGGVNRDDEVYRRHAGLFESVGHRINMMRENWREIGPGIRYGDYTQENVTYQSIMAGTLFGNRGGDNFITGVAISDFFNANNFYEMGEGLGNVRITAVNMETSDVYTEYTGNSGGYSLQVPNGIYEVTATGERISRPLVVRGVQVDDANVKVDFNTRFMNTRYVQGRFFEDTNANQQRDLGDTVLPGMTVYVDLNRNDIQDVGEPIATTDSSGFYKIDSLLPADYVVRAIMPDGWQHTSQGTYLIDTTARSIIGVDFGLQQVDLLPTANHDQAEGLTGQEIVVDVLQNDSDADGALKQDSIRIERVPNNGQVFVRGNTIVYQSNQGFVGRDSFAYTVEDTAGQRSNVGSVSVEVRHDKPWQNPAIREDVDGDGFVSPRDVLALVQEINSAGSQDLRSRTRPSGDPYFDVSGDGYLSPVDVLFVVTHINNGGSGEPPSRLKGTDDFFAALAWEDDEENVRF